MLTESQNIEFKKSWHDEYQKWICGFANAQGGILYIGLRDNGEVCGVQDAKKLMDDNRGLLEKLRLYEGSYLKRAAALLFHPDPEQYVTGAFVKVGFFREGMDLVYQDEVHGNLFQQIETLMDLLCTKYMKAVITYEGIHRIETLPMPREALREALLNACINKDYAEHSPIQIRVYENKLEIINGGVLPEGWTVEALLSSHRSMPYNPDIANTFFCAGEIEAWGRGIERIITALKSQQKRKPDY